MIYSNVVRDFAIRTRKNLIVIDDLAKNKGEAFEVTQLINSMLGLLVFPQQKYIDNIPKISLRDLELKGWPIPKVKGNYAQVKDLNELIRYLRNAVAHFNIEFIGDGNGNISVLRVWNMKPERNSDNQIRRDMNGKTIERKNWQAELGINELRGIAERFIDLLVEDVPPR